MSVELALKIIDDLSNIGRTSDGGSHRLGFSEKDIEAREYFISLIKEIGLDVRVDHFGNIISRYKGNSNERTAVATGSHIDTVPNGGHYDGMLGAALSFAVLKSIKDEGIELKYPIEFILFQLEESSRFGHATMGSKIMAGKDVLHLFEKAVDKDGKTLREVLKEQSLDFNKLQDAARTSDEFVSFIEVHIDQSKDLESVSKPIGVVEAIAAPTRFKVTIVGEAAHSGATKIPFRKDALVAAAELILAVRNLALAYAEKNIVATVGDIKVFPGAMNVVPGRAELYIDLRGIDRDVKTEVTKIIEEESLRIAVRYNLDIDLNKLSDEAPVIMDKSICSHLINASKHFGIECETLVCGAGHDAMNMATLTKTGMILIRCKDGASHQPKEFAEREDIEMAYNILRKTILELAV